MKNSRLERVKAEVEQELRKKRRKTNDAQMSDKPTDAPEPKPIVGNQPAHGEGEEDAGHEMITGHR